MQMLQPPGWATPRGYVQVSALMEDRAKVEIEVTAVVPDSNESTGG